MASSIYVLFGFRKVTKTHKLVKLFLNRVKVCTNASKHPSGEYEQMPGAYLQGQVSVLGELLSQNENFLKEKFVMGNAGIVNAFLLQPRRSLLVYRVMHSCISD